MDTDLHRTRLMTELKDLSQIHRQLATRRSEIKKLGEQMNEMGGKILHFVR